jgi:glycosyltransferase involved in cell wall biosynthesis
MKLLLFTVTFPIGRKNPFLEKEVPILNNYFSKILIVPTSLLFFGRNMKANYSIPDNIEVFRPNLPVFSFESLNLLLKTINSLFCIKYLKFIFSILRGVRHEKPFKYLNILSISIYHALRNIYLSNILMEKVDLRDFDIWYSFWANSCAFIIPTLDAIGNFQSVTRVVRAHGWDLYSERRGCNELMFQESVLKSCDMFYPCSLQGEAYARHKYPAYKHKIEASYLGVPQEELNRGSIDGVFRIASCSSIENVKRVDLIAKALKRIDRRIDWIHFGDGTKMNRLRKIVKELPVNVKVSLMGHQSNKSVMQYYRTHPVDCFLNVSESEGIPVSIMEAMAFGIPTIATDVGGTKELVKPPLCVLLPKNFSLTKLTCILERFSRTSDERQQIQQQQRERFSDNNYEIFIEKIIHLPKKYE